MAGWKQWTRERLAATDLQGYLQDQSVLQFTSAAARDAAIPVGSRVAGMLAYTADTLTYWSWSDGPNRWDVIAVADGGWAACTINGGWLPVANRAVKVRRLGTSRVGLSGWFTNGGSYTANATQVPVTIPVGFRPARDRVTDCPLAGGGRVLLTITVGGSLRVDWGSATFGAGTTHFLDAITYDFLDTGA